MIPGLWDGAPCQALCWQCRACLGLSLSLSLSLCSTPALSLPLSLSQINELKKKENHNHKPRSMKNLSKINVMFSLTLILRLLIIIIVGNFQIPIMCQAMCQRGIYMYISLLTGKWDSTDSNQSWLKPYTLNHNTILLHYAIISKNLNILIILKMFMYILC